MCLSKTHILLSIPISIYLTNILSLSPKQTLLSTSLITLGSILPDIDTPNSFLGYKIRPLSNIIQSIFHHRGLFHSAIFYTIIFLILPFYYTGITNGIIIVSLYLGIISHIILDKSITLCKSCRATRRLRGR